MVITDLEDAARKREVLKKHFPSLVRMFDQVAEKQASEREYQERYKELLEKGRAY